ncbi:MAG: pyridoxamine 5'-phosphate oxidase [Bacteroidetes bacterium]|nr:pyridoxamine 5'-phosphate oxidase [Flavobacteriaceae bacterium]MDA0330358.1 pyridoxamine 5'-phosphate oxidase [Bacteroidota bacterium]MDA0884910.1 pyridoxamine 5'-phosphate oxidase [Bacteroidota bacterium]MDA1225964.1 pyridoxamine 5'-phosphate oxidase [Bacteroidota bacterium]
MELFNYRKSYNKDKLNISDIGKNPIDFFVKWFKEAEKSDQIIEPNAMTISTIDENNFPSSRVVLLKQIKDRSIVFFTNYNSKKGKSLEKNKNICASFYWAPLERQVIIRGHAEKTSINESENYFNSRPFESQAAAIISNQSEDIDSYESLLEMYNSFIDQNKNTKLKRPYNWGGIEIFINQIEFWQGRKNRLHNRVLCNFIENNWDYKLLSP